MITTQQQERAAARHRRRLMAVWCFVASAVLLLASCGPLVMAGIEQDMCEDVSSQGCGPGAPVWAVLAFVVGLGLFVGAVVLLTSPGSTTPKRASDD